METLDNGYQVLHPRSFSRPELQNLREEGGPQRASTVCNTRLYNSLPTDEPDNDNQIRKDFGEWVQAMGETAGFQINVKIIKDEAARHIACCTMNSLNPTMEFNTRHLNNTFFEGRGSRQLDLVIHELGHAAANGAYEHGPTWGNSCATVGAGMAAAALGEAIND